MLKSIKPNLLLILLIFSYSKIIAVSPLSHSSWNESKIILKNNPQKIFHTNNWIIEDGKLEFNINGKKNRFDIYEVENISERVGTFFWQGTIIGASLNVLSLYLLEGSEFNILSFTLESAVGGIIGFFITDWEDFELSTYKLKDTAYQIRLLPTYNFQTNNIGMGINIQF